MEIVELLCDAKCVPYSAFLSGCFRSQMVYIICIIVYV